MSTATQQTQRLPTGGNIAAVIPADRLVIVAKVGLWLIAAGLFLVSLVGNYVQFVGGWEHFLDGTDEAQRALFYGLAWQLMCSIAQFSFLRTKVWWAYFVFLGASVVPSGLSYVPVVVPTLRGWMVAQGLSTALAGILSVFIVGGVVLFADFLQERILVKR
jgi:hypothetical protein